MRLLRVVSAIGFIALWGILWGGCAGSSKPPSWYGKNAVDEKTLIGFGNAKNLEVAQANALNDIITQLQVEVSSKFSSQTQRQDSQISHSSSNEVYLDSKDIELGDVRYTKSEFENGQFYVQAQVAKSALITQFQKKFNTTYNALNLTNLSKCSTLSIKDKTRLENALNDLGLYGQLLQTLGSSSKSLNNLESLLYSSSPLPSARLIIQSNIADVRIHNDLAKELGNFYLIQNDAAHTLNARVLVNNPNERNAKIDVVFNIVDCRNNPIFNTNVSYEATNTKDAFNFALKRVSVQLYKKIQEWIEN